MSMPPPKVNHDRWEPCVRIDEEAPNEFYVVISDNIGEVEAESLHTTKADAEARAAALAKRLGCEWGTNYQ